MKTLRILAICFSITLFFTISTTAQSGTIGDRIKDYSWTQGWTTTEFYTIRGTTYLFLMKEKGMSDSGKNVHIHKVR